jgi:hypothetical protein
MPVSSWLLRASILTATLVMAGCAGWVEDNLTQSTTPWRRVQPADLPITLPENPQFPIVAGRMRSTGAIYTSYRVILGNPTTLSGENRLTMDVHTLPDSLFGALVQPPRSFPVPLYSTETLTETLAREFPGMTAKVADIARRNRYGDYDYAVAQNATNTCVLAWQLLSDHVRTLPRRIEAVRLDYRVCGTDRNPRILLKSFDELILTLPESILEVDDLKRL